MAQIYLAINEWGWVGYEELCMQIKNGGGCYPPRKKADVDNTLRDLNNFLYPTKAEFIKLI